MQLAFHPHSTFDTKSVMKVNTDFAQGSALQKQTMTILVVEQW